MKQGLPTRKTCLQCRHGDTIMLVQVVDSEAGRASSSDLVCRVFGRVSELRSGSKREAPHDTLLI